ncbi:hypothetical protein [Microbacterium sp. B19]|uniref:hypothetical protein n=1 Tax=Microbacterium sp. B19 TaxID=96765 RepID=UPI0011D1A0EF|nr:hypothetical protein [Microbacterium sp. B19]
MSVSIEYLFYACKSWEAGLAARRQARARVLLVDEDAERVMRADGVDAPGLLDGEERDCGYRSTTQQQWGSGRELAHEGGFTDFGIDRRHGCIREAEPLFSRVHGDPLV